MRLNGWQRLLVVVTIAWTLGVAIVAWQVWPIKPKNLRPWEQDFHALARDRGQSLASLVRVMYPRDYSDLSDAELEAAFNAAYPEGGQPSVVSYYTALAVESGGEIARPRFDPTSSAQPIIGYDPDSGRAVIGYDPDSGKTVHSGAPPLIRSVSGIGRVAFPNWMKSEEIDKRAGDLAELRDKNDRGLREEYRTRRASAAKVLALACLAPPIVLCVFGWSIAWIRRGFSA